MTTKAISAKREHELDEIIHAVVLPTGTTDLYMHVDHTPGGKIPGTDYPNGLGGVTRYGPAPIIDGRLHGAPFALGTMQEARYMYAALEGPEGELWQRREARRSRIAEIEAAEAAAETEARATAKEHRRLARKGVDVKEAIGGGSSRRERSSSRPSASMRMRVEESRTQLVS